MGNIATNFPVSAIGQVLFFDYSKKFFGFISEIKCENNTTVDKVFVAENSLSSISKKLKKGDLVYLSIFQGSKGFYAKNVKLISDIMLDDLPRLYKLINIEDIITAFRNTKSSQYDCLAPQSKELICKAIKANITKNWKENDKFTLLNLVRTIKYTSFSEIQIQDAFMDLASKIDWNLEELIELNSILKKQEIAFLALRKFSFKKSSHIKELTNILALSCADEPQVRLLRSILYSEIDDLSGEVLLNIFFNFRNYNIIESENDLINLLNGKALSQASLSTLVLGLTMDCQIDSLKGIVENSVRELPPLEFFKVLNDCKHNKKVAEAILDAYCAVYPIETFQLAVLAGNINGQKAAYKNMFFKTEAEIISFITQFSSLTIPNEILELNRPLTAFIGSFVSADDLHLEEECKHFLLEHKGIAQCLYVKLLVYSLYLKRINKSQLIGILNSFQWTEISALLIKQFIQESNHSENILLEKLSLVFKIHFDILANHDFDRKSFIDNFTIRNVLNRCDGRKKYNAKPWPKDQTPKRWYVKGDVSLDAYEPLECYCEGRFWKKEPLWDSTTNKPSQELYDFYWCKNSYCAARNDVADLSKPFYKWTLTEIAASLNIKIEEIALATLSGWANRMNKIVDHLICRTCNEVLRPLPFRPKTLGNYAVPLFHCVNDDCLEKRVIRFTHCSNSKCVSHKNNEPLDSRDCISCNPTDPNHRGLRCKYCNSTCKICAGNYNPIISQ